MSLKGKAAIVGIGELKPSRTTEGETGMSMIARAARLAIDDSGFDKSQVDGLITGSVAEVSFMAPANVAEYLGLTVNFADIVDLGGASAAGMVWRAAAAIATGVCSTVLCVTGSPRETQVRGPRGGPRFDRSVVGEFELPYGAAGYNYVYALVAQRHMYEYGTTSAQLARIAVDQRTNACSNPEAIFHGQPITVADVLESPLIVEPLHMLEIVMPCAGGAALVVTSAEKARDARQPPVWLLGAGEHCTHRSIANIPDMTTSGIAVTSKKAYEMAGAGPRDIDLVSVYDCYTIMAAISLEDAGFVEKGKVGPFLEEHDLTFAGDLPLNTHGGQLSFGQPGLAGGMSHITEAARQLMGRANGRQVANCELAFVNGNGGMMSEEVSLVLGRLN